MIGEEKMKLLYIVYLLLISNTLYASKLSIVKDESRDELYQQKIRPVNSLFILKLEEIRQSAKPIRNIKQYKNVYNGLAKRVNALIDSIVVSVNRGSISSEEDKDFRRELHRIFEEIDKIKIEILYYENEKPPELKASAMGKVGLNNASALGKVGLNIDINIDNILSWLSRTIDSLDQFFDKRDFIGKLEEKKWKIITS